MVPQKPANHDGQKVITTSYNALPVGIVAFSDSAKK